VGVEIIGNHYFMHAMLFYTPKEFLYVLGHPRKQNGVRIGPDLDDPWTIHHPLMASTPIH
jgi:hypothetical protein